MGPDDVLTIILVVYSIVLHEIAHGFAALRFGDQTAKVHGRLSFNPLLHIDPIGTVLFPLLQLFSTGTVFLGWAKPVPVRTDVLEPRVMGDVVVSLAGIATNLAIAVVMAVLLGIEAFTPPGSMLETVLRRAIIANLALACFNLLPIPPLDGSHAFKYLLPRPVRAQYERIGFFGMFILLALIASGALHGVLIRPVLWLYLQLTALSELVRGLLG